MFYIFITIFIIILIILFKKRVSSRIKTLFLVYRSSKLNNPDLTENDLLEIVMGEYFYKRGNSQKLKNSPITPKHYFEKVFDNKIPNLDGLIAHIVSLEFPEKFKLKPDFVSNIRKEARGGKLTEDTKLKQEIEKMHKKYL